LFKICWSKQIFGQKKKDLVPEILVKKMGCKTVPIKVKKFVLEKNEVENVILKGIGSKQFEKLDPKLMKSNKLLV